ncbi:MAG TPA: succinate dehydrogenase [Flavobacteriales bacterium]|nr:succinate dehydrogenase [Flavobacteriales bacterium]
MDSTAGNIKNATGMGVTERTDNWWIGPMTVLAGLTAFVVYSTWAAFQGVHYAVGMGEGFGGYLSPMYSPLIWIQEGVLGGAPLSHALLGPFPDWWKEYLPDFIPASPAFLIVAFPLSFRFTCYYYRKAYYRAFTWTPPACAVGSLPRKSNSKYAGETGLMLFQNLHRYAMYFAVVFIFILSYDAVLSFFRNGVFGVGVGSVVLLINPILLGSYTFGCHSFRHLMGGRRDCFSCDSRAKVSYGNWKWITKLNENHQLLAWISLIWVGWTDIYVRLVSMGIITDLNTWAT